MLLTVIHAHDLACSVADHSLFTLCHHRRRHLLAHHFPFLFHFFFLLGNLFSFLPVFELLPCAHASAIEGWFFHMNLRCFSLLKGILILCTEHRTRVTADRFNGDSIVETRGTVDTHDRVSGGEATDRNYEHLHGIGGDARIKGGAGNRARTPLNVCGCPGRHDLEDRRAVVETDGRGHGEDAAPRLR